MMAKAWKFEILKELTSKIGSGATPRGGSKVYSEKGVSFIRSQNILDSGFSDTGLARITDQAASELSNVSVESDDILINITGESVGRCCRAPQDFLPARVSQHVAIIRPNSKVLDPVFLLGSLQSPKVQGILHQLSSAGATRRALTKSHLENLEIFMPPIEEQRKIASLIQVIDDHIEINIRIRRTAEELLRSMFVSWFRKYEPWGGTMPASWTTGKLSDVLQHIKVGAKAGFQPDLPYVPVDTIPMRSLGLDGFRSSADAQSGLRMFQKNDILIGAMRVYFHRVSIAPFDGITRSTTFVLRAHDKAFLAYALLLCDQDTTIDYAQGTSKGSTMPYAVWDGGLSDMNIVVPTREHASEFSSLTLPLIEMVRDTFLEVLSLTTAREALLPLLMSGKVQVGDVAL